MLTVVFLMQMKKHVLSILTCVHYQSHLPQRFRPESTSWILQKDDEPKHESEVQKSGEQKMEESGELRTLLSLPSASGEWMALLMD